MITPAVVPDEDGQHGLYVLGLRFHPENAAVSRDEFVALCHAEGATEVDAPGSTRDISTEPLFARRDPFAPWVPGTPPPTELPGVAAFQDTFIKIPLWGYEGDEPLVAGYLDVLAKVSAAGRPMTAGSATERTVRGTHPAADRHPVRVDTDGDFALDDLLSLPSADPAWSISAAEAIRTTLWRLDCLTGAVWLHHHRANGGGAWREPGLTGQLAAVGHLLNGCTDQVRRRLTHRVLLAEPTTSGGAALRTARLTSQDRARIVVLASADSRSAARLVTAVTDAGLPIAAVCWYTPTPTPTPIGPAVSSNYSSAWYPLAQPDLAPPTSMPDSLPATTAATWDEVTAAMRAADADLVLLVGMPIVPACVLDAARLGVLNAHNGALPSHRGMDAVGWALLHNKPIVCSLHLVRPAVDAGEVVAAHPVPIAPTRTLAARVKTTQLRLLLAGAAHVAATGALPHVTPQPAGGTQFYRLHPHLKRLLDASPYAHDDHPQWTVIQP